MKLSFRFEGGQDLAKALNSLPPRVRGRIAREILTGAAEPMRKRMGELAPRAPGAPDLADNMVISAKRKDGELRSDEHLQIVAVGPSRLLKGAHSVIGQGGKRRTVGWSFYSMFLEYGTAHMGAQPFARPAFDSEAPKSLKAISRGLWRELAGRGLGRSVTARGPVSGGPGGSTL